MEPPATLLRSTTTLPERSAAIRALDDVGTSEFGATLRRFRVAAGLSQERLAERARLSTKAVSALEQGSRRAPYRATVAALSTALGLSAAERAELDAARVPRSPLRHRSETVAAEHLLGDEARTNLPYPVASLIGREVEVAQISQLLRGHRLVTVIGAGGVGKTRTTLAVGTAVLEKSGRATWLVELAPLAPSSSVVRALAQVLSVQESPNRPLLETLIAFLGRRRMLLILDNCEHVIAQVRTVASAIVRSCPGVGILATSRESLNICGEQVFRMPSLSTPPLGTSARAQELNGYSSVVLFVDRARAADSRFRLTDADAPYVADICRRLDGIPLALELAAARVPTLAPRELCQELDERFAILTNGDRSALPRQWTMRALIDWSYDLLSCDERRLFEWLSTFAGGFTLEAAATAAEDEVGGQSVTVNVLASLVDKSLLQADHLDNKPTRYRLLESNRQYAREKLIARGALNASARSHATAYLAMAERLEVEWDTSPERHWLAQAETELENWRAALTWAFGEQGDVSIGQRLAGALRLVWSYLGVAEGWRWINTAIETASETTPSLVTAKLELAQSQLAAALGQHKSSHALAQRALVTYRNFDDAFGVAHAQRRMGRALIFLGRIADGEELLQAALTTARARQALRLSGMIVASLALARQVVGDLPSAWTLYGEAESICEATDGQWQLATLWGNMAELAFQDGDPFAALRLAEKALGSHRVQNGAAFLAQGLCNISAYLLALGRYDEAHTRAREALLAADDIQHPVLTAVALQHVAVAAVLRSIAHRREHNPCTSAARLLGCVNARLDRLDVQREYTEQFEYDRAIDALRGALGAHEVVRLLREGFEWCEEQAAVQAAIALAR